MSYIETERDIGRFNGFEPAGERGSRRQSEALAYPRVEDPVVQGIIRDFLVATVGEGYEEDILQRMLEKEIIKEEEVYRFRFSPDYITSHPGSSAFYLIDEIYNLKRNLVYLSVLFPNKKTSRHRHKPPIREIYFPLEGKLLLNREVLPRNGRRVVEPMVIHRARTNDQFALTAIEMTEVWGIPRDQLHEHI